MTSGKVIEAGHSPEDQDDPAPRALVAQARDLRAGLAEIAAAPPARRRAARAAYEAARDDVVYRQLAELPLARLKETTQGRLRLGAIEAAGYRTVGQAGAAGVAGLQQIPGVGPQTATQVIAAARQLSSAMMQRVRLRFDPDARPPLQARLLAELYRYGVARQAASPGRENLDEMAAALDAVLAGSRRAVSRLRMFFSGSRKRDEARSDLSLLEGLMTSVRQSGLDTRLQQSLADLAAQTPDAAALWRDYEERAVFYNGLLIEIGELAPDIEAGQGFIPADIARRVHNHPLDLSLMRASLRGYQAFGAKFALCQRQGDARRRDGPGQDAWRPWPPCAIFASKADGTSSSCARPASWSTGPTRSGGTASWSRTGCTAPTASRTSRCGRAQAASPSPPTTPCGRCASLREWTSACWWWTRRTTSRTWPPSAPRRSASGPRRPAGSCSSPAPRWRTGSRNSESWSATSSPPSSRASAPWTA